MLELLLLRHAKSRRDQAGVEDLERGLAPRGERDAPRMGALLAARDLAPDRVLCSTATRARRTWELARAGLGRAPELLHLEELYLAAPDTMIELARRRGAGARRLLLVGHNPGMHALALRLAGAGRDEAHRALAGKLPTAGLVHLGFEAATWPRLDPDGGRLLGFWRPRDLDRT